jgi:hypothetical protein
MDATNGNKATNTPQVNEITKKYICYVRFEALHGGDYEEWRLLECYAVTFVRTDVSEELSASFIRVTRIGELAATLAVTSKRRTLRIFIP